MIYTDLLFIFAFLPISVIAMLILNEPWEKNLASVVLSAVFILWTRPAYFALAFLPTILSYIGGRLLGRSKSAKAKTALFSAFATASSLICCLLAISAGGYTLKEMLFSASLILLGIKCLDYMLSVYNGEEAERDIFSLMSFMLSYEFFLLGPTVGYSSVRAALQERRLKLCNLAVGAKGFAVGFAQAAVCGLACDRIRIAALYTDAMPWFNSLIGFLATLLEVLVTLSAYHRISASLSLINGVEQADAFSGAIPRSDMSLAVRDAYPSIYNSITRFSKGCGSIITLLVCSALTGIGLGFGNGTVAFIGIVIVGTVILMLGDRQTSGAERTIVILLFAVAGVLLAYQSLDGIQSLTVSLQPSAFDYDITYELYTSLTRLAPWLVIAIVSVTPLPTTLAGYIRLGMSESRSCYTAVRVISCVLSVVLLLVGMVAIISFR